MNKSNGKQTALAGTEDFEFKTEQSVAYLIRDTYRAFGKILQSRISVENLTLAQWYFLRVLWEEQGLTQRELSRRIGMREPTTVSALHVMERRGLVKRVRDTKDRRRTHIFLTKRGESLKSKLLPFALEVNVIGLHGIGKKEIDQFRKVLNKMKDSLEVVIEEEERVRAQEKKARKKRKRTK